MGENHLKWQNMQKQGHSLLNLDLFCNSKFKDFFLFLKMDESTNTPNPWLTLLLVLGKSHVKQNSC